MLWRCGSVVKYLIHVWGCKFHPWFCQYNSKCCNQVCVPYSATIITPALPCALQPSWLSIWEPWDPAAIMTINGREEKQSEIICKVQTINSTYNKVHEKHKWDAITRGKTKEKRSLSTNHPRTASSIPLTKQKPTLTVSQRQRIIEKTLNIIIKSKALGWI